MKCLLVVYHTQSGNTERLIRALVRGAQRNGEVEVRCQRAFATSLEDLLRCDCVVFGTAEYNGYMSGALKDFFDRTFYPAEAKTVSLPYALLVSAGNDGAGTVTAVERIALGYRWKRIADPIVIRGEVTAGVLEQCRELGQLLATGVAFGVF